MSHSFNLSHDDFYVNNVLALQAQFESPRGSAHLGKVEKQKNAVTAALFCRDVKICQGGPQRDTYRTLCHPDILSPHQRINHIAGEAYSKILEEFPSSPEAREADRLPLAQSDRLANAPQSGHPDAGGIYHITSA